MTRDIPLEWPPELFDPQALLDAIMAYGGFDGPRIADDVTYIIAYVETQRRYQRESDARLTERITV